MRRREIQQRVEGFVGFMRGVKRRSRRQSEKRIMLMKTLRRNTNKGGRRRWRD
jgi:hypothetical protein